MEKRSPLGNSLFPLLVPVSVFSTLYGKKKKERGKKKKEGERTKEQTLNNFILDRSQLSTNYDDASVPRTNEQPCKGNKGRTKREREEKKRKKREKKRHTYRSTKSIINTIVSGPEKKPLCITLYTYICIYASVHLRWRSASGAYANSKGCSTKGCGTTGLFVRIFVSASRHCHAGLKSGSPIRASELSPDTPLSMKIITGGAQ